MIAAQHEWSVEDPIHPEDLNLEAIAGLSKHKKPYIAFAFQQNVLTHAAQNAIKEHLSFCLEDEDEGSESLSAGINSANSEDMSIPPPPIHFLIFYEPPFYWLKNM